jgi:hypothetical protein
LRLNSTSKRLSYVGARLPNYTTSYEIICRKVTSLGGFIQQCNHPHPSKNTATPGARKRENSPSNTPRCTRQNLYGDKAYRIFNG